MASNSDEGSRGIEDSSEEESLATLKRKADENDEFEGDTRQRIQEDSDDEGLLPGICVKVEVVEELDNPDSETAELNDESVSSGRPKRKSRAVREIVDPDYVTEWRPPKRKKNTSCPDCGKVFENATEMKKHSIEHQVQTRHKCDECGRCFSKAFGLKTHKRMHGEKNQHCPLCEASFTLAINLNVLPPDERQEVLLVELLESNQELAKGGYRSVAAKAEGAAKWTTVAETLNSGGAAKRDGKGWSKYWTKKKHHLRKAHARGEIDKLTDTDEKMAALIQDELNEESLLTTETESSDSEIDAANTPRTVAKCCQCDQKHPPGDTIEEILVEPDESKEQTGKKIDDDSESTRKRFKSEPDRVKYNVTYARSGPTNRPSRNQLKKLVRLLQRHPELAKGVARTAPGRFEAKKKWASWAKRLNALGGARKDGHAWSKFWIEKKCYLKRVCAKKETWKLSPLYVKMVALLDDGADILSQLEESLTLGQNDESTDEDSAASQSVSDVESSGDETDVLPVVSTPKCGKRPNHSQMVKLVEFLESNPNIVRCAGMNTQARLETRRKWEVLATRLNALGDRTQKDGRGWAKYWIERKCYIKKTLARDKAAKLSALEKRLAPLLGYEIAPTHQPSTSEEDGDTKTIAKERTDTEKKNEDTGDNRTLVEPFLNAETLQASAVSLPEEPQIVVNSIRPSRSQLEALVEFLEKYPDIANGSAKFMVARIRAKRKWARTTARLNDLGLATKDSPGWVKYWVEKKCFIKKMCQMKWLSRLTDLEIRLAQVIGYSIKEVEDKEQGKHFVLVEKRGHCYKSEPVKCDYTLSTSRLSTSDEEDTSVGIVKEGDTVIQVVVEREGSAVKLEASQSEINQDPLGLHAVLIKEERYTESKSGVKNEEEGKTKLEPTERPPSLRGFSNSGETEGRLSSSQIEALVEFMQSASGQDYGTTDRQSEWTDMAEKLNALGGVRKSCLGWMTFWQKKICYLKAVCAQNETPPPNPLDSKLLALMRGQTINTSETDEDFVYGYKADKQDIISRYGSATSVRPSIDQLERLVHFLRRNPGIAKAQLRTAQGQMESKKKWACMAKRLNALEGVRKDGYGWSKYWAERKCVLKKACAKHGPAKLTSMDRKMLALLDVTPETEDVLDESDDTSDRDRGAGDETASDEGDSDEDTTDEDHEGFIKASEPRDSRRPNHSQMMRLVEFLERNPVIVQRRARYQRARMEIKGKWEQLAACLNELGTVKKDAYSWSKFWTEKKCYLKKVCAQQDTTKLSAMEKRLIALMDHDATLSTAQIASPFAPPPLSATDDEEETTRKPVLEGVSGPTVASHTELTHSVFTEDDQMLLEDFFNLETSRKFAANRSEEPPKGAAVPPERVENAPSSDESDAQELDGDQPKMPVRTGNSSRPSLRQIEALLIFLEQNPDIASGKLRGAHNVEGKWDRLAIRLNALGEARKDMRGWVKYWTEKKCYIKKVCKMKWWSRLSDLDVRLAALIGFTIEAIDDEEQGQIMTVKEGKKPSTTVGLKDNEDNGSSSEANEVDAQNSFGRERKTPVVEGVNSNRPSNIQIEVLVKFLERNPAIANCRLRGAKYASHNVEGKWNRMTDKINAAGEARRDRRGWMKYWAEKKSYVKKMCKMKWWSRLSDFDVRLAAVIGFTVEMVEDAEQGKHWTLKETTDDCAKDYIAQESDDSSYQEQETVDDEPLTDESGDQTPNATTERHDEEPPDGVEYINSHRPSLRQLEGLVKFLERNPHLANGTRGITGGIRRSLDVEGNWSRLATKINPLGEACKDGRGWSKCWVEKKCHIKKMCAMKWWSRLSDLDLRLAAVIGYTVEPAEDPVQGSFYTIKDNLPAFGDDVLKGSSSEDQRCLDKQPDQDSSDGEDTVIIQGVNSSRPCTEQVAALVHFMERNPGIAKGEFRGILRRVQRLAVKWNRLVNRLNRLGDARKHRRGWMKFRAVKTVLLTNEGRHMMYHHKRMKCEHCEAYYETKEQLYEHKVAVHPEHPAIPPDVPRKPRSWSTYKIKKKPEEPTPKSTPSKNDSKPTDGDSDYSDEVNGSVDQDEDGNGDSNFDLYTKKEDVPYPIQCAIVSKMHKGRSVSDICQIYNLTAEVINEIWEDRDEFVILKRAGRKSTKYMNSVLDRRILDWLNYQKQNDIQVTGKMLMDVAESFAKENGFVAFNGSKKWLDRFKTRYKITFRSTVRRKRVFSANPNESKWKKQFLEEQWLDARNGFSDEDIYTGDEVGVYYNSSRGRIKKMAGKKYIHGLPKDRLSIFMCTNVTGSDKKKLLVCGTEDPLIHSFRSPDTLPVTYIRHPRGHFTTPMFEEYVKFWNRELQLQNRKAVLILDRATIHSKLTLSHLKLVFVPWKAAQSLMPIKNGIFNKFRDEYRRLLVQEKAMNAVRRVDRNLTSLEALNFLEKAWGRTPSEAIANCFAYTGYDVKNDYAHKQVVVPRITEDDEAELCRMLSDFDVDAYYHDTQAMDNYITVDEEFLTGHGSNGSVFGGNHKAIDPATQRKEIEEILPLATERPETDEVESQVTRSRAMEDLELVRRYLQGNGTGYEVFTKFMDVERFVLRSVANF